MPSSQPSLMPSESPSVSERPTSMPSESPSISTAPSSKPSEHPSVSSWPTSQPSSHPSAQPTMDPTLSSIPSVQPSGRPSISKAPSNQPTGSPSDNMISPSQEPTTNLLSPARLAVYNPFLQAPLCFETGSSCDTGKALIAGVGSYEQNSPNTIDSCNDQSAAVYQNDESIDRIIVKSKDGGTMTAGTMLEIQATVSTAVDILTRSNLDLVGIAQIYYHSELIGKHYHQE